MEEIMLKFPKISLNITRKYKKIKLFVGLFFKKRNNKNLYTAILVWAYKKGQTGFTQPELFEEFGLDSSRELKRWVVNIFFRGSNNDRSLIDVYELRSDGTTNLYALTDKGMSAAVDYLDLKDARKSGRLAMWLGVVAFIVSIVQGFFTYESFKQAGVQIKQNEQAISLSIEPQLDMFLKHAGRDKISGLDSVIFGIKNIGLHSISGLKAEEWASRFAKNECLKNEGRTIGIGGDLWFRGITVLKPGETVEEPVSGLENPSFTSLYTVYVSYMDNSTQKYFTEKKEFLKTPGQIYVESKIPKTEEVKKLLECAERANSGEMFGEGDIIHSR